MIATMVFNRDMVFIGIQGFSFVVNLADAFTKAIQFGESPLEFFNELVSFVMQCVFLSFC